MPVYGDTSALAKLIIEEPGSADTRARLGRRGEALVAVAVGYVELRAAVAAARRDGRLNWEPAEDLIRVEEVWSEVSEVPVDAPLLRTAGDLAERMRLRAYDAVDLAALLWVRASDQMVLACWDRELRRAASELGYALFPENA